MPTHAINWISGGWNADSGLHLIILPIKDGHRGKAGGPQKEMSYLDPLYNQLIKPRVLYGTLYYVDNGMGEKSSGAGAEPPYLRKTSWASGSHGLLIIMSKSLVKCQSMM